MDKNKIMSRIVAVVLALIVGVTFSAAMTEDVSAAVKKPAKVTKLKVVEKTSGTIKVQWKKQKKVSGVSVKYKVAYKTDSEKWQYQKTKKNVKTIKGLKPGRTYKVKVQGYIKKNGSTYKGKYSKTIKVKLPAAVINVGGEEIEVEDGESIVIPTPGGEDYKVKDPVVTDTRAVSPQGSVLIEGTTSEGLPYSYYYGNNGNTFLEVGEVYTSVWGGENGAHAYKVAPENGAIAYWTCDGTEPQVGQEDLVGKCRYTRDTYGYMMRRFSGMPYAPEEGYIETQLRGTTKSGEKDMIFNNDESLTDERVCWVKVFKNGTLVGEFFVNRDRDGYQYDPSQLKEEVVGYIEELNQYDEEHWGPETF